MATWADVVGYMRNNYKIATEEEHGVRIVFDLGNLRSQTVFVWRQALMDGQEEWVQIESPIGALDRIDLVRAISEAGGIVCGGLASMADVLILRHAVPLANLDINELERPLRLVTATADQLERSLVGGDAF